MRLLILFYFFCSFVFFTYSWHDYTKNGVRSFASLENRTFFLKDVIIHSDIPFSQHDFFSLTGLKKGAKISSKDIENACFYLKESNRFEKIYFKIRQYKNEFVLIFKLRAQWLVSHLSIHHIWLGKDLLKQRYLMRPGEPFDENKHQQSLKRYRSYFRKRGYLSAAISANLKRSRKDKLIAVAINIRKGGRFGIKAVDATIEGICDEAFEVFIDRFLRKKLKHHIYKSKLINEVMKDLKIHLLRKGFPLSTIQMEETRISRYGVRLNFNIKIPAESRFIIVGNKQFSYEQLIKHVAREHAVLWSASAPILINVIKQWYLAHGFLQSDVRVDHTEKGWLITIEEGHRIKIKDVRFFGVQPHFCNNLKLMFKNLFLRDYLDESDLLGACESVINFYIQNGFWDAEIEDKDFQEDGGAYILTLYINEGVQRILSNVDVVSDLSDNDQRDLSNFLKNQKPCSFDLRLFDKQREQIVSFLRERDIEGIIQPSFDEKKTNIELVWDVKKKYSQSLFGNTIITGMPFISMQRIESELAYSSGDIWDRKLLDRTFKDLRDLNIFESIRLYPLATRDPYGRRPVVLDLVADDPLELQARVGFIGGNRARANTYKIGGSVFYKNLTNHADTFSFNADATRFWRDISINYAIPHVGGKPFFIDLQFSSKKYDQLCYTGCQSQLYTVSELGGMMNVHAKKGMFLADLHVGVKDVKIYNIFAEAARAIYFAPFLIGQSETYFVFEPQITLDHVDSTINPTVGFVSRLCAHAMIPLSFNSTRIIRVLAEQSFFVPFHRRLVGAFRGRVGYIFSPSFYRLLPSERFYLGGPCTVRSYQQDFVAPIVSYEQGDCQQWAPQGSCTMLNLNFELRGALNQKLGLVLFYDNGFLRNEMTGRFCCGHAIGGGVRYLTPLGPLRFDIGWKGKFYVADRSSLAWFLSVGHAF